MKKLVIGILAHVDAGKTTLSEALLYTGGALVTPGRVDRGDTFLDTEELEKQRGITIFAKEARLSLFERTELIFVDTPGHGDFSGEMERSLNILDAAILVVSASESVGGHTKTLFNLLKRYRVPTIFFVNKCDMENAAYDEVLLQLKRELSYDIAELDSLFGEGDKTSVYEDIAGTSEEAMEEYLEKGELSMETIIRGISQMSFFPCLHGSALKCSGIDTLTYLLDSLTEPKKKTNEPVAYCYKITRDKNNRRLSHFKLLGGSFALKSLINNEKINEIRICSGSKYELTGNAEAGDLIAVAGLENTRQGRIYDTYGETVLPKELQEYYPRLGREPIIEPLLFYSVTHQDTVDRRVLAANLRELEEELPELKVEYSEEFHEIRIGLMGSVQIEIIKELVRSKYGIDIDFCVGNIAYKETIAHAVLGIGHFEPLRHYAEVHLRLEPLERGMGIQIDTELSEDFLDRNWQRLIMTHLTEKIHRGVLTGSPITDMKLTLVGGKSHNKHTEGGDFRQATYRAVRQGLMKAESILLEPTYAYTIEVPEVYIGRVMTDIDRMKGTLEIKNISAGMACIEGNAPVATLHGYSETLKAYTGGKGCISLTPAEYMVCHNSREIIAEKDYDPEEDGRNPSGSVFCIHGAGTNIPWYDVEEYCHVPPCINGMGDKEATDRIMTGEGQFHRPVSGDISIGMDEIDEIIGRTGNANKRREIRSRKGISRDRLSKNRTKQEGTISPREVVYKGTPHRESFLLVDGYNVIFAWNELKEIAAANIDAARDRLLDIMTNYRAMVKDEIIVVFDAYRVKNHPVSYSDYQNIHVVYTATAQTADQYIEHFSNINKNRYDITVATSDGLEQIITRGQGCRVWSSRELQERIGQCSKAFNEKYRVR